MNKDNQYLTLSVLKKRSEGYINVGFSLFFALWLVRITWQLWQDGERLALLIPVVAIVIALYIGIRWLILCTKKLRLTPDELQVWQLGRCVKTIPAHTLRMACLVTRTEKSGRNNTSRRLRRRLAISCSSMRELEDRELDSVTSYLVKRMKYRLPIDGVWVDCYPEMVAALRHCYPHLQWEKVSTVSLKKPKIKDNDPYCFMRENSIGNFAGGILILVIAVVLSAFAFLAYQESMPWMTLLTVGSGVLMIGIHVVALGIAKTLIRLSPKGVEMHCGRMTRFYPSEKLRTAIVLTELDYREGEYQVIVFSTLSAREIASRQEKIMKRYPGGGKQLRQWKKIPNWGTRLVYRYSRKLLTIGTLRSRETNYIMHNPQREQTLRELYPHLQWFQMTDEFEVIV